ncbi:MAG: hypothetical protein ACKOIA_05230 [Acidimicrobiia bacterium]|jgi:hypothetical protein
MDDAEFPRPRPDPAKLLSSWMEWERGESTPGRVMADLKHAGLPDLLRSLVADAASVDSRAETQGG